MKERLDVLLFKQGLCRSRTAAGVLISRGSVLVNGVVETKSSKFVLVDSKIEVIDPLAFVSRAGEKLEHALTTWGIAVTGLIAADIGASTGGFTDCLLQHGAEKVYAIDVGTNQLVKSLRDNPKVVSLEQTDIRKANLPEKVDLIVIDVSFISLLHVLPKAVTMLKKDGMVIALVKPQFEVGPDVVDKHGVVTEESTRKEVLEKIRSAATQLGLKIQGELVSPIKGNAGNTEFLLWLQKQ
jgi:23S rRNA (cytidine1920-2'-O)/16S rRNA (cytidine1409-2'-O)-methyltransferase